MKLRTVLSLLLAFVFTSIQAQEITWGESSKNVTTANNYHPIGQEGDNTYVYHGKFSGVTVYDGEFKGIIEIYDGNLNLKTSVELEKKKKGQKKKDVSKVDKVVWTKENILVIRSKHDKSTDTKSIFSQVFNRSNSQLSPTEKLVGQVFSPKNNSTTLHCITSEDRSKTLIYTKLKKVKGSPSEYAFFVLDEEGKLIWKRETKFGKSSDTNYQDIELSNSGEVYAVITELDSSRDIEAISICSLGENERDDNNYEIEPTYDLNFTGFDLEISPKGTIVYSSLHRDGCYYEEIDSALSKSIVKNEFNINQLADIVKFKSREELGDKYVSSQIKTIDILKYAFHENGSTTILGQFFNKKTSKSSNGVVKTTHYYYDLIAVNIDNSGKITWSKRVPKRHMAVNSAQYINVSVATSNDKIQIFYNDHIDNFSNGIAKINVMGAKQTEALKVEISSDGKVTKESIFNGIERKLMFDSWSSGQLSEDMFFIYSAAPIKGMANYEKISFGLMKL